MRHPSRVNYVFLRSVLHVNVNAIQNRLRNMLEVRVLSCFVVARAIKYTHNFQGCFTHYSDVIMSMVASQIASLTIAYSTVYSGADQRKHQSSATLAFVREIHRWPVNSPHKGPVTRKMFPFDDVFMWWSNSTAVHHVYRLTHHIYPHETIAKPQPTKAE